MAHDSVLNPGVFAPERLKIAKDEEPLASQLSRMIVLVGVPVALGPRGRTQVFGCLMRRTRDINVRLTKCREVARFNLEIAQRFVYRKSSKP